jgi:RNA polymerase sigma-70 factor (ECF subfamily)
MVRPASGPLDGELVERIADGDLRALGILFDRHETEVKRFVSRLGVAPHEVDDLVQLTFLDVARASARFVHGSAVRSWLFGLTLMVVRRHRHSLSRISARLAKWSSEPPPLAPAPADELLDMRRRAEQAARALARLSHKKREVFVMVVLEGMPGEEAARSLAIPVATVWTRLHHARRELRQMLKEPKP